MPFRRTGIAALPLHDGRAPAWLFQRMVPLAGEIVTHITAEYGAADVLRRLSDPFWFQAFGCVLGFDWHSSGVTTTVCGAVKEALKDRGGELGLFAAGGKGATSRRAPAEILSGSERLGTDGDSLVRASRLTAKVDHAAVQDGYQLYHHVFFFTAGGHWSVVQQGMCADTHMARRYHWLSEGLESFVDEPHQAVCCDDRRPVLNLVAHESASVRGGAAALAREAPEVALEAMTAVPALVMPRRHMLFPELDVDDSRLHRILLSTYERQPADFEALLALSGVGPRTLRALALTAELIHGTPASTRDPARFAFAHGGKDGIPHPVDRVTYDRTIDVLGRAINRAKVDRSLKVGAFRRLAALQDNEPAAGGASASVRTR